MRTYCVEVDENGLWKDEILHHLEDCAASADLRTRILDCMTGILARDGYSQLECIAVRIDPTPAENVVCREAGDGFEITIGRDGVFVITLRD